MEQHQPSAFALALTNKLVAGEAFVLRDSDLTQLTEWEAAVLERTARKRHYTVETSPDAFGIRTFIPERK